MTGALIPHEDVSVADWIVGSVRFFDHTVGSLVPPTFPAYARVFHPAGLAEAPVRWDTVAAANGRTAHPEMEWMAITGSWRYLHDETQPDVWDQSPSEGSLPQACARALIEVLGPSTDQAWFAAWEGFGDVLFPVGDAVPKVLMPYRSMILLSGSLSAVTESVAQHDQRANLWWSEDRRWCVATDIDLMSTYVGGTQASIDAICAHPDLEAAPVGPDTRITWDSDSVNPTPPDRS